MGHMITSSATMIDLRTLTRLGMVGPPSPCPSEQPFSSASSSLSEGSSHRSHEDDISIVTGNECACVCDLTGTELGVRGRKRAPIRGQERTKRDNHGKKSNNDDGIIMKG